MGCLAPDASWAGVGRIRTTRAHRRVRRRPGTRQHGTSRASGRPRRTSLGRGHRSHRGLAPRCRHPAADGLVRAAAGDRLPRSRDQAEAGRRRERHAWAAPERRDDRRRRAGHDSLAHGVRPRPSALEVRRARGDRRVPATRGRSGLVGSARSPGSRVFAEFASSGCSSRSAARKPSPRGSQRSGCTGTTPVCRGPRSSSGCTTTGAVGCTGWTSRFPSCATPLSTTARSFTPLMTTGPTTSSAATGWTSTGTGPWTSSRSMTSTVRRPPPRPGSRRAVAEARRVLAVWNARRTA